MPDIFQIKTQGIPGYTPDDFEQEALNIVNQERAEWSEEAVFVTDKVYYMMRKVIEQARKFYYGVFDTPKDEVTGEDKIWYPLTEYSVEAVVKSVDLDTKDILIQPGTPQAVGVTTLIRALVLNYLKRMGFGQLLNDTIRVLARDGTAVVKTVEAIDKKTGRKTIFSYLVNLLNIWIDPAARTIQDSTIIERIVMSESDIQDMGDVWNNTQFVNFSLAVPQVPNTWGTSTGKMPYTEVWERWGKIKKSWVTKDSKDNNTWIDGHIISSGLGGANIVHLIRENPRKDGIKPYEEAWYKRLDGRWYGRGVAEMLFGLQEYVNQIINTRKSNSLILQNGIFLIRKGSGITPDMISSLSAGGGIPVTDINRDVKQLTTQDYRQSSYTDEDRARLLADNVTGAHDINRGEAGRASVSATATLTQDRNIRDTFVLIQEGIGFFIERLILRHYIPMLKQIVKSEDMIRVTGEPEVLEEIDKTIVEFRTNEFINEEISRTGFYPEQEQVDEFTQKQAKFLKSQGKNRFVKYFRGMFDEDIDVDIMITDERFNRVVAVQQLKEMLIAFSRLPVASKLNSDAILKEILNLMGIRGQFFLQEERVPLLAKGLAQTGRRMKELPEELPNEVTALENASGLPGLGAAAGEQVINSGVPPLAERFPVQ